MYVRIYVCMYIYIYIERERDRGGKAPSHPTKTHKCPIHIKTSSRSGHWHLDGADTEVGMLPGISRKRSVRAGESARKPELAGAPRRGPTLLPAP